MKFRNRRWVWAVLALLWIAAPALPASLEDDGQLPEGWLSTVAEEIRLSEYRFARTADGALSAPNRAEGLRSRFDAHGLRVTSRVGADTGDAEWHFDLRLTGFGRGDELSPVGPVEPLADDNGIEYVRRSLVEWYVNDTGGLEQGFDIPAPAAGSGDLVLEMEVGGLKAYPVLSMNSPEADS